MPDLKYIHRELKRKSVTLQLLWEEYINQNPDGYRYSYFCELPLFLVVGTHLFVPSYLRTGSAKNPSPMR